MASTRGISCPSVLVLLVVFFAPFLSLDGFTSAVPHPPDASPSPSLSSSYEPAKPDYNEPTKPDYGKSEKPTKPSRPNPCPTLRVTGGRASPDGYDREVILVNEQTPGPLIEAWEGEEFCVSYSRFATGNEAERDDSEKEQEQETGCRDRDCHASRKFHGGVGWTTIETLSGSLTSKLYPPSSPSLHPLVSFPICLPCLTLPQITVINDYEKEFSMHWHGILQNGTLHMDGVSGVTQFNIPPYGGKFDYCFTPWESGQYW